jgi:glycosyltransferase involved in cell wall biosynthesis
MKQKESSLISIIIPLYNKEKFVKRSLASVLSQSYGNFEVLVVNDGSTDRSVEEVRAVGDPRTRLIDKPNGGVSSARNRGLEEAKGAYVAFLDADDTWYPRHLEVLKAGFDAYPDAAMTANALEYRWGDEAQVSAEQTDEKAGITWQEENYLHSLSRGAFPIHIGSSMFRRSLLEESQIRFFEHMRLGEDVNFMLRVSRLGRIMRSDYTGLVYYQDDDQSAMKRKEREAALVPRYFEGMETERWSQEELKQIRTFLLREYLKKAYQNRHLPMRREELSVHMGGSISVGRSAALPYLAIRYTPEIVFSLYRKLK